jgi:hypothetical protein
VSSVNPLVRCRIRRANNNHYLSGGIVMEGKRMISDPMNVPVAGRRPASDDTGAASAAGGLRLAIHDPQRDELTDRLALFVPHGPTSGQRKAALRMFRLYLFNESGRMARHIQVEMGVEASFLAYSFHGFPPLGVESPGPGMWKLEKQSDDTFRCFFEGGADFVCHAGKRRDLGEVSIRVPHGEADGGPVPLSIRYDIAAEEHRGSGLLTVLLLAEGTPADVYEDRSRLAAIPPSPAPAPVFDQRGWTVGTQVNVVGDYVDQRAATVIVGDGNVVGDHSRSRVVKRDAPTGDAAPGRSEREDQAGEIASLRHQLDQARENMRLIREREAEYVLGTDVPLQLVKEKRRLGERIANLEARLADMGAESD